jgi:tetratricopeptide (TPR) repeat protein
MFASSLTAKRFLLKVLPLVAALFLSISLTSLTQAQDAEHQRAIDLFEANNFVAALPLLEKVAAARPNDVQILSRLGFALYANSATEKDPAARQKMRDRARAALTRSRELGDNSNLTSITLDALSGPDASMIPFSNIKTAEAAIREGEAAFVKGDMDAAIAAYKRALDADPHLYDAALYESETSLRGGFT